MRAEYVDHMGDDLAVVNAARVSFAKEAKEFKEQDAKLIKYLAKHKHWTPFAHTAIKLRMAAPVPIRTQCFKHKIGLVENEESRRYISCEPEIYIPVFRKAADNKKQGSGGEFTGKEQENLQQFYKKSTGKAVEDYKAALAMGVCEEQARFLLPQGAIVNWIWTGNLVSFANFVEKRTASDAQGEIQELANKVKELIKPLFPVSWEALTETK